MRCWVCCCLRHRYDCPLCIVSVRLPLHDGLDFLVFRFRNSRLELSLRFFGQFYPLALDPCIIANISAPFYQENGAVKRCNQEHGQQGTNKDKPPVIVQIWLRSDESVRSETSQVDDFECGNKRLLVQASHQLWRRGHHLLFRLGFWLQIKLGVAFVRLFASWLCRFVLFFTFVLLLVSLRIRLVLFRVFFGFVRLFDVLLAFLRFRPSRDFNQNLEQDRDRNCEDIGDSARHEKLGQVQASW